MGYCAVGARLCPALAPRPIRPRWLSGSGAQPRRRLVVRLEAGARALRPAPGCGSYLQMMPDGRLSIVNVTVEPGATLVPALGLW